MSATRQTELEDMKEKMGFGASDNYGRREGWRRTGHGDVRAARSPMRRAARIARFWKRCYAEGCRRQPRARSEAKDDMANATNSLLAVQAEAQKTDRRV